MAAPAITGSNVAVTFASAASIALAAPTREAGNGLLVSVWIEDSGKSPSTPTGWTLLGSAKQGGNLYELVYGRIADNTATDNFSSSWTGSTGRFGEMRRIKGNVANVASWAVSVGHNGSAATFAFKTATAPQAECLGVGFYNTRNEHTLKVSPSGWTSDAAPWTPVMTKVLGAGATGEVTGGEFAASEEWVTLLVIVPPVAVAATTSTRRNLLGVGR